MLSPAQPSQPSPSSREKKCIIFSMFFAHLYMEIGKMMRSTNGKIKFWISWFFMIFRWFFMIFRWFSMIFHDFSIIFMIFHDFSMVFDALQWRYVHFWTFVFPKKRLAWIRTHARLRPSFSGHLVSGGNHYTTAAVAGLRVATSKRCPTGRGGPFHA